ncbi:hypothetical protein FRB97_001400, partial [Tulasnella sp. 331]
MKKVKKVFRCLRHQHQPSNSDITEGITQAHGEGHQSSVGRSSPASNPALSSRNESTVNHSTRHPAIQGGIPSGSDDTNVAGPPSFPSGTPPIVPASGIPPRSAEGLDQFPSGTQQIPDPGLTNQASLPVPASSPTLIGQNPTSAHESADPAEAQRQTSLHTLRECLIGGASIALSGLAVTAQFIPVPYLQLAVTAASQIITIAKAIPKNRGDCQDLLDRASTLLIAITPFAGRPPLNDEALESIEHLAKALTGITNELRTIKADINYRQIKTAVTSVLTYQAVQDRIDACSSKLNWAMGVFQIESLAQAELDRLQHHLELRKDIKELATVGTELSSSPSLSSRLTSLATFPAGTNLLEQRLQPAPARFDARDAASGCLEGTRTRILHDIRDWIFNTNSDPLQIFWLYGLAGTGKSTVAHTISEYCAAAGNLGASFFFSRDQADRTDGRRVFSTIAFQLAYYIPSFQSHLLKAVQDDPEAHKSVDLQTQLKKLIVEPLQGVVDAPSPMVVVLDALDECAEPKHAKNIILLLAKAASSLPSHIRLRIFVTSRPEVHLEKSFADSISPIVSNITKLHDIELSIVKADIRLYLRTHLQDAEDIATDDE